MKPTNFFFLIFFALVKVSLLDEEDDDYDPNNIDFLLVGFENYRENKADITFKALFMNLSNKPMTKSFGFYANTTYLKNSSDPNSSAVEMRDANCTIENTKSNDDYIYFNCSIPISNISNIKKINILRKNNYFGGETFPADYMRLAPMINLVEFTKELYILNLTKEIEEKHGQFILKGEMHKNLNDNGEFKMVNDDMNGTLKCQKTSGLSYECKLLPTSIIENRTIDQRPADSSKSKIIIIARYLKNFNITYPKNSTTDDLDPNEKKATIISVGNFKPSNALEDAKGKIYLKCGDYALKYLKEFIRFYADINYNPITNLRMLQNKEKIEVIGTKNLSEISKGIVSYDLTYKNTTNKTIVAISSPRDISFSDNGTFSGENNEMNIEFSGDETYEFLKKEEKRYEPMYLKKNKKNNNDEGNYDAIINYDSFSFDFDTQDDILDIVNKTDVEVSYKPKNEGRYFDKCNIEKIGNESYSIKCSPKRSVYALMDTLLIDITNLLKKRRLSSVSVRILQDAINTTLLPDTNSTGVIDYTYDPKIGKFISKKSSGGLSGGAITAIVLAIIFAILAVAFLIFFCNRPLASVDKNNNIINVPNSSTNINE
jgi:hypothetical protein